MRRNGYVGASGKNYFRFLDPKRFDFPRPMDKPIAKFRRFHLRTFSVIFFVGKAKSPPYFYFLFIWLTDIKRKRATWWATHDDNFHQVWSWYDYSLRSYSVVVAGTLTSCDLELNSGHTWRVTSLTRSTPQPSLKILRLSILDSYELRRPPYIGHR